MTVSEVIDAMDETEVKLRLGHILNTWEWDSEEDLEEVCEEEKCIIEERAMKENMTIDDKVNALSLTKARKMLSDIVSADDMVVETERCGREI